MSQRTFSELLVDLQHFKFNRENKIASSAFGNVYRASLPLFSFDQPIDCAIHVVVEGINSVSVVKTFFFQIECQSSLKHPAILPILGYSLPLCGNKEYALISPYMPNGTVEDLYLRSKSPPTNFDTREAIIIFGIASGMAFCHQHNVVHRDLKPANILLDSNYHPKITDFALAKYFVEGTDGEVHMESNVGTPLYMAPELVLDEDASISEKIDVFSFAITLYQILTKKRGYDELENISYFKLIREVNRGLRPTIIEGSIPHIFSDLLDRCWNADPSVRPSFIEVVKDFMNRRNEYFNQPNVDLNALNKYIDEVTSDLKL